MEFKINGKKTNNGYTEENSFKVLYKSAYDK